STIFSGGCTWWRCRCTCGSGASPSARWRWSRARPAGGSSGPSPSIRTRRRSTGCGPRARWGGGARRRPGAAASRSTPRSRRSRPERWRASSSGSRAAPRSRSKSPRRGRSSSTTWPVSPPFSRRARGRGSVWTPTAGGRAPRRRTRSGSSTRRCVLPCATVEELVALRARLERDGVLVDVAADESIRRAEDPLRVVRAGGADRAVVKVAPLGGPRRLLAVAAEVGVPVTVSSALDSAVGVAAGVATAAALPGGDDEVPAAGLGTGGFFIEDVLDPGAFALVDGHLPVTAVAPDPARLDGLRARGGRRDWWHQRIRRCWELL